MENNNENLAIAFYIISIILIIVMGAFMYIQKIEAHRQITKLENKVMEMQETINELRGKNNSVSNNKNEINSNKNNLTQFDAEFYDLKDIAKQYSDFDNLKNYKDFNYDLDSDGKIDKITLRHIKEEDEEIYSSEYDILEYNGEKFAEYYYGSEIYIVDLNENDKNVEVVIFDEGPSDDPNYTIYSKIGNKMIKLKNIGGYPLKIDKKGTVLVKDSYNGGTVPEIYFGYYKVQDGKIEDINADIKNIKDIELKSSFLYFSEDFNNLDKFNEKGECDKSRLKEFNIEELNEDIAFNILNFERIDYENGVEEYKIYVELSDGRKGYVFHIQFAG